MPIGIDGPLLAEVIPEVLVAQKKEESSRDDIQRLNKEILKAYEAGLYQQATKLSPSPVGTFFLRCAAANAWLLSEKGQNMGLMDKGI